MRDYDAQEARDKVAQMTTKEKIKHYFGYYKIHILVGICILAGVISFIHTQVTKDKFLMYFGVINGNQINREMLQEDMREILGATGRENVEVYTDLSSEATAASTGEMYSMLAIYAAADELDIAFSDEAGIEFLGLSDGLVNVEDWLSPELMSMWADRVTEFGVDEEGGMKENPTLVQRPVAVDISGTKLMEKLGLADNTHYMVMFAGSERIAEVEKFCQYVYQVEK